MNDPPSPPPNSLGPNVDPNARSEDSCRIVRLVASSLYELLELVQRASKDARWHYNQADQTRFQPGDLNRLAIVAKNPDELEQKLRLTVARAGRRSNRPLVRHNIFLHQRAETRPRVAFLFPGQGSQYPGMLRDLIQIYAPAAEAMAELDTVLREQKVPSFAELAWVGPDRALGDDVWRTQLAVLGADLIMLRAVESLGVAPAYVAGHSFGEFPALVATGVWTVDESVRATLARCDAIEACPEIHGRMLATSAEPERVERLCAAIGHVYPAAYNGPRQTVAAGRVDAVEELARRLETAGHGSRVLAVPRPFHTPLLQAAVEPLRRGLASIDVRPPRVPLLGTVTGTLLSDPAEIRENLVRQMTTPICHVDVIRRLAAERVDVLIEVGPRQVLTGLSLKILPDDGPIAIASDPPREDGLSQLLVVQACLETLGAFDLTLNGGR
ncbi:MAG: ACP S-malonyltransferase [Pirellulales bacterium]|nr:ACP S-malonyltransferase [Pirellulales bacterium]